MYLIWQGSAQNNTAEKSLSDLFVLVFSSSCLHWSSLAVREESHFSTVCCRKTRACWFLSPLTRLCCSKTIKTCTKDLQINTHTHTHTHTQIIVSPTLCAFNFNHLQFWEILLLFHYLQCSVFLVFHSDGDASAQWTQLFSTFLLLQSVQTAFRISLQSFPDYCVNNLVTFCAVATKKYVLNLGVWRYTQLTRRDETRHDNGFTRSRCEFNTIFKKT